MSKNKLNTKDIKLFITELTIGLICLFIFFKTKNILFIVAMLISSIYIMKKNTFKYGFKVLLILFFIGLIYFLGFEPLYARLGLLGEFKLELIKVNFIPFKTISNYLKAMFDIKYAYKMAYDTSSLFLNLVGNFFCFSPLSILLPLSFAKMKKTKNLLITTFLICICFEALQCFTMNGSFDIDDLILNYSGILLVYFIAKKDLISFIEKILLNKKTIINYKNIIIIACLSLFVSVTLVFSYFYRIKKEREYIHYIGTYEIYYEYNDSKEENYKEIIYEDDFVIFYLNNHHADSVTITIKDTTTTLTDWLKGNTEFYVDPYRLTSTDIDITIIEKEIVHN